MVPAFRPGDRVLAFNWGKLGVGDVVVFKNKGKCYIKRVKKIEGKEVFVEGDNKAKSAKMFPIFSSDVVGRVVLKY